MIETIGQNQLSQSAAGAASTKLTDNFDTFLTLLTTQLQNQDPLEPLKSNEFTQQLVQFSSVEQTIATNKNLEQLLNLTFAGFASEAVGYIGKEVTAESSTAVMTEGNAEWSYELESPADEAQFFITDSAGQLVHQATLSNLSGSNKFTWDGKGANGRQLPDGNYNLKVVAVDVSDNEVPVTMKQSGIVTSVSFDNDTPTLTVNGSGIRLSDVISVKDAGGA